MSNRTSQTISKSDYNRVLVTETAPYETPIIFSNDGLYKLSNRKLPQGSILQALFNDLVSASDWKQTVPYHYQIRKNATEYRRLSLIHPLSQWQVKIFYEKYKSLICHYCSKSAFSIRAPYKTASVFYYKNSWDNLSQYKRGAVEDEGSDSRRKHSSSFFTYRGYDRLYKFFSSSEFIRLEKSYPLLHSLDVSKCFDSVYTHSIAWATKEKQYIKARPLATTFGLQFDKIMQKCNHNETNGIVIGPEVSRVFAEILFQEIDRLISAKLSRRDPSLENERDYCVRRYVDDIFIFSSNEKTQEIVKEVYIENLRLYNFHCNPAKSHSYARPFFTAKSRVIQTLSVKVNLFADKFLEEDHDKTVLRPKEIFRLQRFVRSFIDEIKETCTTHGVGYDEVSSYIISAFFERSKRLINIVSLHEESDPTWYRDASLAILEIIFFFYSVAPSVSASYKLSSCIVLLYRFSEQHLEPFEDTIKQRIYELTFSFLHGREGDRVPSIDCFVPLEEINVLLAVGDMGMDYKLPVDTVSRICCSSKSYYGLISGLFYVKDHPPYSEIRRSLIASIDDRLKDLSDVKQNTEKACLFLDAISCPYIDKRRREKWIARFLKAMHRGPASEQALASFFSSTKTHYWFTNWFEVDLLNSLERKELRQVY